MASHPRAIEAPHEMLPPSLLQPSAPLQPLCFSPPILGGMDVGRGGGCECRQCCSGGWLAWRYSSGAVRSASLCQIVSHCCLIWLFPALRGACVHQPGLGGRGWSLNVLGWGMVVVLAGGPRTSPTSAPCVAAGTEGAALLGCLGWGESLSPKTGLMCSFLLPCFLQCLAMSTDSALPACYGTTTSALVGLSSGASPLLPTSSQAVCMAQH